MSVCDIALSIKASHHNWAIAGLISITSSHRNIMC